MDSRPAAGDGHAAAVAGNARSAGGRRGGGSPSGRRATWAVAETMRRRVTRTPRCVAPARTLSRWLQALLSGSGTRSTASDPLRLIDHAKARRAGIIATTSCRHSASGVIQTVPQSRLRMWQQPARPDHEPLDGPGPRRVNCGQDANVSSLHAFLWVHGNRVRNRRGLQAFPPLARGSQSGPRVVLKSRSRRATKPGAFVPWRHPTTPRPLSRAPLIRPTRTARSWP